jgi:hypothetical protein
MDQPHIKQARIPKGLQGPSGWPLKHPGPVLRGFLSLESHHLLGLLAQAIDAQMHDIATL